MTVTQLSLISDLPAVASTASSTPPPVGSIIYLASYLFKLALSAEVTPPDTPNIYTGAIEIMGDVGSMNLDPLTGPRGFPGQAFFPFRRQTTPIVNTPQDLPTDLTDTKTDIGKYWQIATVVDQVVTGVKSYVWYGTFWRVFQIGTTGPPGPTPNISVSVEQIAPQKPPTYPDTTSYVETDGTSLDPTWIFDLASPAGPPGPTTPLYEFADVDESQDCLCFDLLACSGHYNSKGQAIFKPLTASHFATQFYSIPESAFWGFSGYAQQHLVGQYTLGPHPFKWTPIVWGHIGGQSGFWGDVSLMDRINSIWMTLQDWGSNIITDVGHVVTTIEGLLGDIVTFNFSALLSDVESLLLGGVTTIETVFNNILNDLGIALGAVTGLITGGTLSVNPFKIGMQVLMDNPTSGQQISRGIGNVLGAVNIYPHYSSNPFTGDNITPTNNEAVVQENATCDLYMNLWNDGFYGDYTFHPQNAQLFVLALPLEQGAYFAPF